MSSVITTTIPTAAESSDRGARLLALRTLRRLRRSPSEAREAYYLAPLTCQACREPCTDLRGHVVLNEQICGACHDALEYAIPRGLLF